ncbi:synaptic vesicle glycoprotein 2B-like [Schistocerca nitens]|uniref:synaptic vesicle glycoprotein 2B-like n=1 Tax=Schistocerca nitens TaxID=7011 RepID=UPI0021192197|nr:synaptic vesicle glycoprotein 2B-like [Schistocerca nitens]XP_049807230.1 synaptic vesicle glycoprotein 2B-like [Schistocerca nitens]
MPVRRSTGVLSESAALVRSTEGMSYTEEGGSMLATAPHDEAALDVEEELMDYVDSDISVLAQFHEDAIRQAGSGYFQWMLLFVVGLGMAADTVELFVVPYILPSAEVEMCLGSREKIWLSFITLIGMMVGGVVWGNLADRMGRRRTLLSALSVNAVFSVIAAFMPTYGTFMTARFCSGVGIGGAMPIVFAYYSEFLPKSDRGKCLSWLLIFWALGGIFVALIAWMKMPRTGVDVVMENKEHFSAWHQFLLICALPSLAAIIGLSFVPESPRYLLEAGREVEAMMVYQRIYKTNNMHNPAAHAQYQLSELELPSKRPSGRGLSSPPSPGKSVLADMTYSIETFWNSFLQLFVYPHRRLTAVLVILWFTVSFGYYGLTAWFPEYIKLMKNEEYSNKAQYTNGKNFTNYTFNSSIENQVFHDCIFNNVQFSHLTLSHVIFENCTLDNVEFTNIKSSRTYFKNSIVKYSRFVDTNLSDQHFKNCLLQNNTKLSLIPGCQKDFDYNIYLKEVFQENLVGQLAILPGAFISGFIIDKTGRVKVIGISMFLSSIAAFFIWFLDTDAAVMIFEAIFNFMFIAGWNVIDVITIESYPTHLRTTGFGFMCATSRLSGVIGMNTFLSSIGSSRAIPMLITTAVLLIGGVVSIKLPETGSSLL